MSLSVFIDVLGGFGLFLTKLSGQVAKGRLGRPQGSQTTELGCSGKPLKGWRPANLFAKVFPQSLGRYRDPHLGLGGRRGRRRFSHNNQMSPVYRRPDLLAKGLSSFGIDTLVKEGMLQRVSHGWYATASADSSQVLAATAHTRLGCLSAAQFHGLWVPRPRLGLDGHPDGHGAMASYIPTAYGPATDIHVLATASECARSISQRVWKASKGRTRVCLHRCGGDKNQLVATVEEAVEQVARWHDWETAMVVIESALNLRKVSKAWVEAMLDRLPPSKAAKLRNFRIGSESGTETRVAHYFRRRGLEVRQQVQLTPAYRVDAVVGESLILESDSLAHHGSEKAYVNDRARAGALEELGYNVINLSYEQVWDHWDDTKRMLNSLIVQRKHLRRVKSWRKT